MNNSLKKTLLLSLLIIFLNHTVALCTVHSIPNSTTDTLRMFIENTALWATGDTIMLSSDGKYYETTTIDIKQEITIKGDPSLSRKPTVYFFGSGFQVHTDSISITIEGFSAIGLNPEITEEQDFAKALLQFDVPGFSVFDDITIEDMFIQSFTQITQFYKNQYGEYKSFELHNCIVDDISGETALDFRKASVEQINITNNSFTDIEHGFFGELYYQDNANLPDQGRYVEQNVVIDHNSFYNVVGASNKSLIQNNAGIDGSVNLVFSNNIVSTLFWEDAARPFRINSLAGDFHFSHCVFHDFNSSYGSGAYNLSAVEAANANVTAESIDTIDPVFYNISGIGDHDLTVSNNAFYSMSTVGGLIGDPRWVPSSQRTIHKIANTGPDVLEAFIEDTTLWSSGDTILIGESSTYIITDTIDILQDIVILGDPVLESKPIVRIYDKGFSAKADSISITLENFKVIGTEPEDSSTITIAKSVLNFEEEGQNRFKDIRFIDMEISDFEQISTLYTPGYGHYESFTLRNSIIRNLHKGYAIDPNYSSIESTTITNNTFVELKEGFFGQLYYYDPSNLPEQEEQINQFVTIDHNTFYRTTGADTSSFILNSEGSDGSVTLNYTNNIVSSLWDKTHAQPFDINVNAGDFSFSNNAFHDFKTGYLNGRYTMDSLSLQANVSISGMDTAYPGFLDTTLADGFDLTISNLLYLNYGTDGSLIGDPRWVPEAASTIHSVSAINLEQFIEDITLWTPGDTVLLTDTEPYIVGNTIDIFQELTIMGDEDLESKPTIVFLENGFCVNTDSINISLINFKVSGIEPDGAGVKTEAPAFIRFSDINSKFFKQIALTGIELDNFETIIEFYSNSYGNYDSVLIDDCIFKNIIGDYAFKTNHASIQKLSITNSTFIEISNGFIDEVYYQDASNSPAQAEFYEQNIFIDHNTFFRVSGTSGSSFLDFSAINDGSIDFVFSNNIICSLFDKSDAKPFQVNEQCGDLLFTNSTFYNFESGIEGFNLETIADQENVTVQLIDNVFPDLKDTANYDLRLWNYLPVRFASTDGKEIGDPRWIPEVYPLTADHIHPLENTTPNILNWFIENREIWVPGDTVLLVSEGVYIEEGTVDIHQSIVIMSDTTLSSKPVIHFSSNGFRTVEDSLSVTIRDIDFNGYKSNGVEKSPFILRGYTPSGSVYYNIEIDNCDAEGFMGGLDLNDGKNSFYDTVIVNNVIWQDFEGEYCVDPNLNFVKYLQVSNSTFYHIENGFIKNPGFAKEENGDTIQTKKIVVNQNTFYKVGGNNNSLVQINDPNDNSVDFLFSNNIASELNDPNNARPFRINAAAGAFQFNNSVMHNLDASGSSLNFSDAIALSNVDATSIFYDAPGYSNPAGGEFYLPSDSPLLTSGTDAQMIGDPRWAPDEIIDPGVFTQIQTVNSTIIYPNPAKDNLFVKTNRSCKLTFYDLAGRQQLSKQVFQDEKIDVSILKKGVYIVLIQQNESTETIKFIKE